MSKNCLKEYLTEECQTCPDWHDNKVTETSTGKTISIGCGAHFPIMECKAFRKMWEERERDIEKESAI